MKKEFVTIKDIVSGFTGLNAEEKAFMERNAESICKGINKAAEGLMSKEEVDEMFKDINAKLDSTVIENTNLKKQNEELANAVKNLADNVEKAKQAGFAPAVQSRFYEKFDEMMDSKKMQNIISGGEKASGWFDGFTVKEITNVASVSENYDGDVLISAQSNTIANQFAAPKTSIRDIANVIPGDPSLPSFVYLRVKSFDRNARYQTENGRLSQSSLELEEVSTSVRRVGSYFDLSKNLLAVRVQLRAFLVANIPGIITQSENFGVLFGDGKQSHLQGLINTPGVGSIESQITAAIFTGKAGDVKTVEGYNGNKDTLVEFKNPVSEALSSMMITFTGAAVNTDLNSAHSIVKINDRQVVILGAEYKGVETAKDTMTFVINHASFKRVETPNSGDVIAAVLACLSFAQYTPNFIALNPLTVYAIETEKDTMGRKLDIIQNVNGRKYISGVPVVEMNDLPVGSYFAGDFQNGAALYDYSKLQLQWVEDAETALYNMIRLIFQEQLALVVYMPWAFAYGSLDALKTAITKPASNG